MSDMPEASLDVQDETPLTAEVTAASQPYIGEWNQLVSTTNWEKGRIISTWRASLIDDGADQAAYADEAWARLVGGVTGQHVGRLRRVYQKFGQSYPQFRGLYWSHFQAAIDWEDPEMWLEGAVQSGWSVSQMRKQRWETLGAVESEEPMTEDEVSGELDEDFEPAQNQEPLESSLTPEYTEIAAGPLHEGPDFGDEDESDDEPRAESDSSEEEALMEHPPVATPLERVRPFEALGELPDDVLEAVENFKLLILKHRREEWAAVSQSDMVGALEALKQMVLAPADEAAPF